MKFRIKEIQLDNSFELSYYYTVAVEGYFWGWTNLDEHGYRYDPDGYNNMAKVEIKEKAFDLIDLYMRKHPKKKVTEIQYITR